MTLATRMPGFAILGLVLALQTSPTWASRPVGATVTGEITATPGTLQVEVAHHAYHVKADTPAAKALRNFYLGQTVDLVFDVPAQNAEPEVVSISPHPGG